MNNPSNTPAAPSPSALSAAISCVSDYDSEALPVSHAQAIIRRCITPINAIEKVAIRSALERILAADIISPINVPAYDNSAMDGYAFHSDSLRPDDGNLSDTVLTIIGTSHAGRAFEDAVAPGQTIRIMTGALMPEGLDTVVPQEFVSVSACAASDPLQAARLCITIPAGTVKAGANRRLAGEDLQAGAAALRKGRILRPADLGLLASLGIAEVPVQRRLRVAFFSTGDELRSVGEVLDPGCVYDSNRYTLYGMLQRLGCDVIDMGVVADDPAALEVAFKSAADNADAIITSGGVSVGDADHTRQMMAKLGEVAFWKLGMRPGRPLAFGTINSANKPAVFFGLPGNPVAVMVSFYFFAREALLYMMGAQSVPLPLMPVASACAIRKRPGRTEYQRGILARDVDGEWSVRPTGAQGSGILRSMTEANCMIVLGHDKGDVGLGDLVEVILFEGLI
ncbi:molybdopterin molybdotransferase MoeA [Glaciimonas immobilis]|uniref:Molybdopterin molybdenumtransferase n=1 Tax=Glaciimonas immobilis TaxID=728004 RepID=A0A840RS12_9BURK|nr:gephyrin-like molybdotransferase Glp [Glaciimonas immobilis]KAF3997941.1 molybdopterin molybdenumtransferase MoeA [Glaciimonas immobilis]MBB5199391.1 molybdopterin molybdotransferase [Glaciimonas immobilis]